MDDARERLTPYVGERENTWCPHCLKTTVTGGPIYALATTGPFRIGGWGICEECGYSPYAKETQ